MAKVTINHNNGIVSAYESDRAVNLYQFLAGLKLIDAPCGGAGGCGKCKVKILNPHVACQEKEKETFTEAEIAEGWRLACLHSIAEDITLALPPEEVLTEIISQGYLRDFVLKPHIAKRLDQNGNTVVMAGQEIIGIEQSDTRNRLYGLAIDIGTTTIVAGLIDLSNGQELASISCLNGQKTFGQDVITRINYAMTNTNGTLIQQKTILQDLRKLIKGVIAQCSRDYTITSKDIYEITVGGNNTMIHLLAGIDPSSMGVSPYLPAFTGALVLKAVKDLHLPVSEFCLVYCLPAVSAFVGGDITAGILACGIHQEAGNTLFIDIGTNGEMVLSRNGRLVACSCAAGPALEGMNISCGVRAAEGAIEDVQLRGSGADIVVEVSVIGNVKPTGLCGSGLLAAVAELVRTGILHKSGRLLEHPLVEKVAGKKRFVIDRDNEIYLTQQDIRQVQLAKGAILSGIQTMVQAAGMDFSEIDRVLVAGQFGAHLKAESLTGSGLIPRELESVITYVGNTSKSGAYLCLLSTAERETVEKVAGQVSYIELSHLEGFDNVFVKAMEF
ncbi:Na(+)-translocating NADH-quinone reductase subunit F [Sporotomaculum syntrophicum]|uniref:Na(+)-translocating NADH-quinone reductase subunit F n=1 Tax=Sporotomaculum syntrophicum TaxID=182264 RepID=A0A9D3B091_9FIRM|nr:ASKHA domain-containing protein [Sporotomaculum syntrophicum]KAF1086699.1 Na(+)-translocating NADH-quinone reductase subunit F [Sporotomaculum syntrophicum]